ncbi:type IV toxin-antitoxin system AbiEi family antitoxin domain-containing protein [Nonomuraea ferruginea]|uniref:Type IV toxin-antitoxin system AbiEi family antitoxin domain-containing protein n=1 Tax=Nonomuraea ferruginea TaxID=46174 RepID=A0ABT4T785_9ACTN|nr:type IV toxin-antitoxin system AbiEi family antitoxin domain-containing protein [Nonomuraea ferruginea]MDA0645003.1 type IV toxin-antitoxin system AbiEi family antitoxin domain-containing protein [Nonomuraea ferruginea]
MIDKSDQADPGADDTDGQRWGQRTFSPEVVERAHEEIRRQEAERRRRLFGDRQPFAVPEDIIDFDFEPEAGVPVDYALNTAAATDATGGRMSHERCYELSIAAARQQGFLTRAQLARLGVDDGELDRLREAGLLTELDHGVYQHAASSVALKYGYSYAAWLALAPDRFRWERPQTATDDAVLSHESAARLLGLGALAVPRTIFTAPAELPAPRATIIHVERLAAADVTVVEGIPVTTPFRTILDLMRGFTDHDDFGRALQEAVRRDLVDLQEVYDAMLPLAPAHSFPTAGPDFVAHFLPDLDPSGLTPRNLRAYAELTAADSVAEAQSRVAVLLAELRYPTGAQHPADDGLSRQIAAEIVGRLRR